MQKFNRSAKILLIGLLAGILNGLFGSGGGTVLVPCLVFILGVEDHKAHATAIAVILPMSVVSAVIYYRFQVVDMPLTFKTAIGSILGALTGSMLLNKVPIYLLRKVFGIAMIIAAVRMVF